jgi:hypothetical protein
MVNIKTLLESAEDLRDHPPALPQSEKEAWVLSWPSPLPGSAKELIELIREQHCQLLTRFEDLEKRDSKAIAGEKIASPLNMAATPLSHAYSKRRSPFILRKQPINFPNGPCTCW